MTPSDRVGTFYNRPRIKPEVDWIVEYFQRSPQMCFVPARSHFRARIDGVPRPCSVRALVSYAMGFPLPELRFCDPTCGTDGCVNPHHQVHAKPASTPYGA